MYLNLQHRINKLFGVYRYYWNKRPNGVYSFNYHRIGDHNQTSFDPNIYSCDEESFELQINFFKNNFDVISVCELTDIIKTNKFSSGRYTLLTFDDGYIDNYTNAYPILKRNNCPATMFITTDFINNQILPWWDEVAWLIKNNNDAFISRINWNLPSDIQSLSTSNKIKAILRSIKDNKKLSMEDKLNILRKYAANNINFQLYDKQLFMTWDMIREMANNNIDIGSHTCSHQILSHLSESKQLLELEKSKELIEQELNKDVTVFAYPVGGSEAFTTKTIELIERVGYDFALTFIAGINKYPNKNKYYLNRFSIDKQCNLKVIKDLIGLSSKKSNS